MAYSAFVNLYVYPKVPGDGQPLPLVLDNYVSEFMSRNELSYNASPSRGNDMTLNNDEEAFYVPTIEFKVADLPIETLSALLQIINSKGFVVYYFDLELGEYVYRSMYATESTIDQLLHVGQSAYGGIASCKFVSRYGYPYTRRDDTTHYTAEYKYHMYQLHAHRSSNNYDPTGTGDESYV